MPSLGAARVLALVGLALAAACGSDISTARPQSGAVLITYHAPGLDFAGFHGFSMATRAARVTGTPGAPVVLVDAPALLGAVSAGLAAAGLSARASVDPASPPGAPVAADLAVNVSLLEPPSPTSPGFWTGTAEQLSPATWGLPAGTTWRYPWGWLDQQPVASGTLLVELGDLRSGGAAGTAPVVWSVLIQGVATAGGSYGEPATLAAVGRALARWPLPAGGEAP